MYTQARIAADLKELRNSSVFAFFMINALFVVIVFLLQLNKDNLHIKWPFGVKTNITYDETTQEVTISGTSTNRMPSVQCTVQQRLFDVPNVHTSNSVFFFSFRFYSPFIPIAFVHPTIIHTKPNNYVLLFIHSFASSALETRLELPRT